MIHVNDSLDFFTLFSGFGGFDIGAIAAGARHVGGVELDDRIAAVARVNGLDTTTADILDFDPHNAPDMDLLHTSPPCPNFSSAKKGGEETDLDRALAAKIGLFLTVKRPRFFTLENVEQYIKSDSLSIITAVLLQLGYKYNFFILNSADYGVAQTRRRLILKASQSGAGLGRPEPTHEETPPPLFGLPRWVSWYDAVADIAASFPDSKFSPWQYKLLPPTFDRSFVMNAGNPNGNETRKYRLEDEPIKTITATDSTNIRAFLVWSGNANGAGGRLYGDNELAPTVTAGIGGKSGSPKILYSDLSIYGRVVKFSTQGIARLQSFPDSYQAPGNRKLACKGYGNAVPPLLARHIVASLLKS